MILINITSFDLHYADIKSPILYYIIEICGVLFWYIISKDIIQENSLIEYIGKNTLIIVGTHGYVLILIKDIITRLNLEANIMNIVIFLPTMLIELVIISLINSRCKWLVKWPFN